MNQILLLHRLSYSLYFFLVLLIDVTGIVLAIIRVMSKGQYFFTFVPKQRAEFSFSKQLFHY